MQIPGLAYASGISVFLPVAVGATRIRLLDRAMKTFLLLQTIYAIVIALQFYLALHHLTNLWISHVYAVIEYPFLMAVFSLWQKNRIVEKAMLISIAFFVAFWVVASIYLEPFTAPATYTYPVSRMIYCAVGLYTLRKISLESTSPILKDPRFWIISSLLISSTGDLMFYALRDVISGLSQQELLTAFGIHWILIIVTNLFYSEGYICTSPKNSGGLSALAQ